MRLLFNHPWILAIFVAAGLAEYFWRRARGRGYDLGAAAGSFGVALGQAVLRPLNFAATAVVLFAVQGFALWQIPGATWHWDWRWWAAGFVAVELAYYGFHRASHQVRWMWATHAVHHSAHQLVLPSAIRLGWPEFFSLGWLFFVPLVLAGFPPEMIGTLLALSLIYQYPLHTEAIGRLGPLEWVLNTPSHHRAHHSCEADYLDCNFGGVLIVFDRLFGTFRAEPGGRGLRYGLAKPMESTNPVHIALHEWGALLREMRARPGLLPKLQVALGRP
ncbi:MAG: sterol desaturase family protein [Sphingomonadales bacterium]|nr:sterol desaturase family protein [Sphingomonadales bacterium]